MYFSPKRLQESTLKLFRGTDTPLHFHCHKRYKKVIPEQLCHIVLWHCLTWTSIGGIWGFANHIHCTRKQNTCMSTNSHVVWYFTCVYLHSQTTVHMHLTNQSYVDHGKNLNSPQLEFHAGIKVLVLESLVYICNATHNV